MFQGHAAKPVVGTKHVVPDPLVLCCQLPPHRLRTPYQGYAAVNPPVVRGQLLRRPTGACAPHYRIGIAFETEAETGGTFTDSVHAFKLKSTIPVKMILTACDGSPVTTGTYTTQVIKFSSATTSDVPIDATPTDAATSGNAFRLTDAVTGEWHFNLDTKAQGLSTGIWQIKVTLSDGSVHTAFVELK